MSFRLTRNMDHSSLDLRTAAALATAEWAGKRADLEQRLAQSLPKSPKTLGLQLPQVDAIYRLQRAAK